MALNKFFNYKKGSGGGSGGSGHSIPYTIQLKVDVIDGLDTILETLIPPNSNNNNNNNFSLNNVEFELQWHRGSHKGVVAGLTMNNEYSLSTNQTIYVPCHFKKEGDELVSKRLTMNLKKVDGKKRVKLATLQIDIAHIANKEDSKPRVYKSNMKGIDIPGLKLYIEFTASAHPGIDQSFIDEMEKQYAMMYRDRRESVSSEISSTLSADSSSSVGDHQQQQSTTPPSQRRNSDLGKQSANGDDPFDFNFEPASQFLTDSKSLTSSKDNNIASNSLHGSMTSTGGLASSQPHLSVPSEPSLMTSKQIINTTISPPYNPNLSPIRSNNININNNNTSGTNSTLSPSYTYERSFEEEKLYGIRSPNLTSTSYSNVYSQSPTFSPIPPNSPIISRRNSIGVGDLYDMKMKAANPVIGGENASSSSNKLEKEKKKSKFSVLRPKFPSLRRRHSISADPAQSPQLNESFDTQNTLTSKLMEQQSIKSPPSTSNQSDNSYSLNNSSHGNHPGLRSSSAGLSTSQQNVIYNYNNNPQPPLHSSSNQLHHDSQPSLQSILMTRSGDDKLKFLNEEMILYKKPEYSEGCPVGALVIYKCLFEWKEFNPHNHVALGKILDSFEYISRVENVDRETSCYWLSTTFSLCHLLDLSYGARMNNKTLSGIEKSPDLDLSSNTETQNIRFMQIKMKQYQKRYWRLLWTNGLRLELDHVLKRMVELIKKDDFDNSPLFVNYLLATLEFLQKRIPFTSVWPSVFKQIFFYTSGYLCNCILENSQYSNTKCAINLKLYLSSISQWIQENKQLNYFYYYKIEMTPIFQLLNVMMVDKNTLGDESIRRDVCPTLNPTQLAVLLLTFHSDSGEEVQPQVIKSLQDEGIKKQQLNIQTNLSIVFDLPENTEPCKRIIDVKIPPIKSIDNNKKFKFIYKPNHVY